MADAYTHSHTLISGTARSRALIPDSPAMIAAARPKGDRIIAAAFSSGSTFSNLAIFIYSTQWDPLTVLGSAERAYTEFVAFRVCHCDSATLPRFADQTSTKFHDPTNRFVNVRDDET